MTGPALTIVDLAAVVGPARLRNIVHTQINAGQPTLDELIACFDAVARRGIAGTALLRQELDSMVDNEPVPGSVLERAVADLLVDNGVDGFRRQYRPPWYDGLRGVVDFAHPELRIVIETDGRRWHSREQEMVDDRRRDRQAIKHGWVTIRITWREVTTRPAATVEEIKSIVARRSRELLATA